MLLRAALIILFSFPLSSPEEKYTITELLSNISETRYQWIFEKLPNDNKFLIFSESYKGKTDTSIILLTKILNEFGKCEDTVRSLLTSMSFCEKYFFIKISLVNLFLYSLLQLIFNMINNGASLINYRGSGGSWIGWSGDHAGDMLTINNLNYNIHNGDKLPLVTSIVCAGGDFAVQNCFGEVWLQTGTPTNPKGAIGFIGPSEHDTKTWFNNANDLGIYQGFTQEGINQCAAMMLQ